MAVDAIGRRRVPFRQSVTPTRQIVRKSPGSSDDALIIGVEGRRAAHVNPMRRLGSAEMPVKICRGNVKCLYVHAQSPRQASVAQSLDVRGRLTGSLRFPALKLADNVFGRYVFFQCFHEVVFQLQLHPNNRSVWIELTAVTGH
jgi:hypothetical protein